MQWWQKPEDLTNAYCPCDSVLKDSLMRVQLREKREEPTVILCSFEEETKEKWKGSWEEKE